MNTQLQTPPEQSAIAARDIDSAREEPVSVVHMMCELWGRNQHNPELTGITVS